MEFMVGITIVIYIARTIVLLVFRRQTVPNVRPIFMVKDVQILVHLVVMEIVHALMVEALSVNRDLSGNFVTHV
jgi:hypothetical protein